MSIPQVKRDRAKLVSVASFFIGIAFFVVFYGSFLLIPGNFGIIDHDFFLAWQLAVNDALRHGELLHWFHQMCGGVPGLANPQSGALSPFNVIGLFTGPVSQFKIELLILGALGLSGFLYFCQLRRIPPYYALFGFFIWAGNGLVATRILHGQTTYYPLLVLPLFVALLFRTVTPDEREDHHWRIMGQSPGTLLAGTLLCTLVLYLDGFHVFIYNYPLLGILALGLAYQHRNLTPVIAMVLWAGAGVVLSLPRLLPTLELLQHFPREVPIKEFIDVGGLISALIQGDLREIYFRTSEGMTDVHWVGYIAYVGVLPLILTACFFLLARDKAKASWLIAMLFSFAISLGHVSDWAPWSILHALPIAEQVRAPFKFISFFLLGIAFLSILGAHSINQSLTSQLQRYGKPTVLAMTTVLLLLFVLAVDLNRAHQPLFRDAFNQHQESHQTIDRSKPLASHDLEQHVMFTGVANNLGIINCYDPISPRNEALPNVPLARIIEGTGQVQADTRPNEISVIATIASDAGADILINQNDHPYWTVLEGRGQLIRDPEVGLLVINVPKGHSVTQLRYRSGSFYASLKLTAILAGALVLLIFRLSPAYTKWRGSASKT